MKSDMEKWNVSTWVQKINFSICSRIKNNHNIWHLLCSYSSSAMLSGFQTLFHLVLMAAPWDEQGFTKEGNWDWGFKRTSLGHMVWWTRLLYNKYSLIRLVPCTVDAGPGHRFALANDIRANVSVQVMSLGLQWQGMFPPVPLLLTTCRWEHAPGANCPPAWIQEWDTQSRAIQLT